MSKTIRTRLRSSLLLLAASVLVPQAWAFYPTGFFNESGQLVIIKWPLSTMDANHDGDVSGPNEGIVLNFETGNGNNGFTASEVTKVLAGFEEWERVSTAYLAFTQGPSIIDPVELEGSLDVIDAFNAVVFESDEEVETGGGSLLNGSITLTLTAAAYEDTYVTIGNTTFPVSGGQIVDVDTIFGEVNRTVENTGDEFSFQGSATIASGLGFGLDHSPLTNIDENASEQEGLFVEDRVVALRNFDGSIGLRGVTSTMLNAPFIYLEDNGSRTDSHADLAPDDIAAVTFLYPRSNVDIFFDINQRARTQARSGFASEPIAGAWIRAWCDADNNPGTARVPFVDTFTGLYEWEQNVDFRGNFKLKGLFKQLETIDENTFTANYTVSCSEFLPLVMGDDDRVEYDSTHQDEGFGFDSLFPAEVFAETENLLGLQNVNQGTPLQFDLNTRKIVSQVNGKTLDVMLAAGRPMFGDQNAVCPLNVVVAGLETIQGPTMIRGLRDKVLLNTALGTALVDAYYRAAPTMAQYLLDHKNVLAGARLAARGFEWVVVHAEWLLAMVTSVLILAFGAKYLRRRRAAVVSALLVGGLAALTFAPPADAWLLPYDISDYLRMSTDVIHGKVTTVESYWTDDHTRIVTDVTVCVETVIKGEQNRDGLVHFQLPTGRVGAIGRFSQDLPTFDRGEEVVLFLQCQKRGFTIMGGIAGKYAVKADPKTGKKYVLPTSIAGKSRLEKEIAKMRQESTSEKGASTPAKSETAPQRTVVALDDFVAHLRRVEREQERAEKQA